MDWQPGAPVFGSSRPARTWMPHATSNMPTCQHHALVRKERRPFKHTSLIMSLPYGILDVRTQPCHANLPSVFLPKVTTLFLGGWPRKWRHCRRATKGGWLQAADSAVRLLRRPPKQTPSPRPVHANTPLEVIPHIFTSVFASFGVCYVSMHPQTSKSTPDDQMWWGEGGEGWKGDNVGSFLIDAKKKLQQQTHTHTNKNPLKIRHVCVACAEGEREAWKGQKLGCLMPNAALKRARSVGKSPGQARKDSNATPSRRKPCSFAASVHPAHVATPMLANLEMSAPLAFLQLLFKPALSIAPISSRLALCGQDLVEKETGPLLLDSWDWGSDSRPLPGSYPNHSNFPFFPSPLQTAEIGRWPMRSGCLVRGGCRLGICSNATDAADITDTPSELPRL